MLAEECQRLTRIPVPVGQRWNSGVEHEAAYEKQKAEWAKFDFGPHYVDDDKLASILGDGDHPDHPFEPAANRSDLGIRDCLLKMMKAMRGELPSSRHLTERVRDHRSLFWFEFDKNRVFLVVGNGERQNQLPSLALLGFPIPLPLDGGTD
jgi:hypothetical protein